MLQLPIPETAVSPRVQTANRIFYFLSACMCIAGLLLNYLRPLNAQPWQWADDALYLRQSSAAANGEWLGKLDPVLLSKAPGFALFVAGSNKLGIPLRLAEWMLMAAAVYLWARASRPLIASTGVSAFLAAMSLMFIPAVGTELPLVRNTFFGTLIIFTLICVSGFLIRARAGLGARGWVIGTAFCLGVCSVTREEAGWLYIPVGAALLLGVRKLNRRHWRSVGLTSALAFAVLKAPAYTISYINHQSYGFNAVSLRQHVAFRRLYQALVSSSDAGATRYVPVPEKTRLQLYDVSPTFALLRPYLDGSPTDDIARNRGHHQLNRVEGLEREFFVSNLEFALARAIWLAGYQDGHALQGYCVQVAEEIEAAQRRGEIKTSGPIAPMIGRFELSDSATVLRATISSLDMLVRGLGIRVDGVPPHDPYAGDLTNWFAFTRTWPHVASEKNSISRRVFDTWYQICGYVHCVILTFGVGAAAFGLLWRTRDSLVFAGLFLVGLAGLMAFSLTMGVADTLAFPVLQWPMGYNRMGYFCLYFLLLVCSTGLPFHWVRKPGEEKTVQVTPSTH